MTGVFVLLSDKLSKQDIIRLMIELEQAKMIRFDTNILGEVKINPIGFSPDTWVWLYNKKWGIDERDIDIMSIVESALLVKKC